MAVPVAAIQSGQERDRGQAASAANREAVASAVHAAVRARRRLALTQRRRAIQLSEFDSTMKRLIKQIAVEIAAGVDDRHARAEMRVRLYAAVAALVGALIDDHRATGLRTRRWRNWSLAAGCSVCCLLGTLVGIWLAGG